MRHDRSRYQRASTVSKSVMTHPKELQWRPSMQAETTNCRSEQSGSSPTINRIRLAKGIRDGYEVHRAALERGAAVRRLPRQGLRVDRPGDVATVAGRAH